MVAMTLLTVTTCSPWSSWQWQDLVQILDKQHATSSSHPQVKSIDIFLPVLKKSWLNVISNTEHAFFLKTNLAFDSPDIYKWIIVYVPFVRFNNISNQKSFIYVNVKCKLHVETNFLHNSLYKCCIANIMLLMESWLDNDVNCGNTNTLLS